MVGNEPGPLALSAKGPTTVLELHTVFPLLFGMGPLKYVRAGGGWIGYVNT